MAVVSFYLGAQVVLSVVIKNAAGTVVDPTTGPTVKVKDPAGVTTTVIYPAAGVVRDSLGNFHYNFSTTLEGLHKVRWDGTGTNMGAVESEFAVKETLF